MSLKLGYRHANLLEALNELALSVQLECFLGEVLGASLGRCAFDLGLRVLRRLVGLNCNTRWVLLHF